MYFTSHQSLSSRFFFWKIISEKEEEDKRKSKKHCFTLGFNLIEVCVWRGAWCHTKLRRFTPLSSIRLKPEPQCYYLFYCNNGLPYKILLGKKKWGFFSVISVRMWSPHCNAHKTVLKDTHIKDISKRTTCL